MVDPAPIDRSRSLKGQAYYKYTEVFLAWLGLYGLYGLERSLATAPRHPSGQRATQLGQDVEVGIRVRDQGLGVCGGNGLLLGSSRDQLRYNRYLVRDG